MHEIEAVAPLLCSPTRSSFYRCVKRSLDISLSLAGIIVSMPVVTLAAAAVWLEDGSLPFYISRRVGRDGKSFRMAKLRTMRPVRCREGIAGSSLTERNRITKVGRFLRRSKIDELPQLLNVTSGSMSFIGPRPHIIAEQHIFNDALLRSLRPGLTDLASLVFIDLNEAVYGTNPPTDHELLKINALKRALASAHARKESLSFDLRILTLTVVALVDRRFAAKRARSLAESITGTGGHHSLAACRIILERSLGTRRGGR